MNNGLKTFLIVLAIILVPATAGLGYWYLTRKKSEQDPESKAGDSAIPGTAPTSTGTNTPGSTTQSTTGVNTAFPLKLNASVKTNLVKEIQNVINDNIKNAIPPMAPVYDGEYFTSLVVDGYYGKKTAAAVKFLFPETDGKTFTESQYDKLTGKRATGSYLLF